VLSERRIKESVVVVVGRDLPSTDTLAGTVASMVA
jgi:hypothetical protein